MAEYHNPQQDPDAQKRLVVVFVLIFIGIAVMQYLLPKQPQKPNTPAPQQTQQAPPLSSAPAAMAPASASESPSVSAGSAPVKKAENKSETTIESGLYRVTFTNEGGRIRSWVLKKGRYLPDSEIDLVNPAAVAETGYPLSFFAYDKDLEKKLNSALYVPSATGSQKAPFTLNFAYSDGDLQASKKFTFDESYVISVDTEVTYKGQKVQAYPQWPSGLGDANSPAAYTSGKILWQRNSDIQRKAAQSGWFLTGKKSISDGETVSGPFQWVAAADQYFAAAFMPASPEDTSAVTLHRQIEIPKDPAKPNDEKTKVSVLGVAAGSTHGSTHERLFAGPKAVGLLESIPAQHGGPDLRGMLDFGMFGFIARPLFAWLTWTHDHWVPTRDGWGWSIAILTLIINGVLLPLRISSMKSALKMSKIQPQMRAIQDKYKRYSMTDPRRADMQKEMSELYKREGVNPLGGCLPMLLQMPFLFAFYSMLSNAYEMRQAHWLWISDLSSTDPYHLLPIFVVVSMFFTQQSAPSSGMDPAQQKMMKFMMPLMIGGMTWYLPAGLGVYWAISNMIAWVQQIFINRSAFGQQVRKSMERRASRKK
ncbi:MAG TPA: membrane protein insertase YidC [Candidatus Angelobacter sp.]|nr:membrane protein insertase YidC [Candidatus Angelobacter sp.]